MEPTAITADMIMVMVIIAAAVFLFVVEWVRVDVVALAVMVILPMLDLIDDREAFAGLGSNAVVAIIAVIIMGAGLDRTGVINRLTRPVVSLAGTSRGRITALLSITVAIISSIMQNIGAAALFLPAIRRICRTARLPVSRILMPVGFSAILGGTITLVGSSPLIMLNDLIEPLGIERFGLFDVTPVGLALVAAGVAYFILLGRWVLPARKEETGPGDDPLAPFPMVGELFELVMSNQPPEEPLVRDLCQRFLVHPVALWQSREHTKLVPPDRDVRVEAGAVLAVYGPRRLVRRMAEHYGMTLRPAPRTFAEDLSSDVSSVVEAVVPPRSELLGRRMGEVHLRRNGLVTPLALWRRRRLYLGGLIDLALEPGDALLLHGTWDNLHALEEKRQLIFSRPLVGEQAHPEKALRALGCFLLATAMVVFTDLKLSVCLMSGALAMVFTGVLSIGQAYRAVDWRTVFLLAGLIPLGLATEQSGAAAFFAHKLLGLLGPVPPLVLMLVVGALSTVLTLVVSNVGATVLLVPLVAQLAEGSGADPRMLVLVVGLAASNSFILPTHQVNALYMGPGGYKSKDFLKAGGGMTLLFLIVMSLMLYLFY